MIREPSKSVISSIKKSRLRRIGAINTEALSVIMEVMRYTRGLSTLYAKANASRRKAILERIEDYIISRYVVMFSGVRDGIVDSYNKGAIDVEKMVKSAIGASVSYEVVDDLPKTKKFKITNKVLSEKSVLKRSRIMAKRVTSIIENSNTNGLSVKETTKKLEVEFGLRGVSDEKLTTRSKNMLRKGVFSKSNGHFYDVYRIARTETMRMSSVRNEEAFDKLKKEGFDVRFKLVSTIDSRTREQSIQMNGNISREDGRFKYPNGIFYLKTEAPARWSINDRETLATVFID